MEHIRHVGEEKNTGANVGIGLWELVEEEPGPAPVMPDHITPAASGVETIKRVVSSN